MISAAEADVKIDLKSDEKAQTKNSENEKAKADEKGKFWNEDPKISERAATVEAEADDHVTSKELKDAAKEIEASEDIDLEGLGLIDHGLDTNVNLAQQKEKAKAEGKAKAKHPGHEEGPKAATGGQKLLLN